MYAPLFRPYHAYDIRVVCMLILPTAIGNDFLLIRAAACVQYNDEKNYE